METTPSQSGPRPDVRSEPPGHQPPAAPTWYYRLNLMAAATLWITIFCLVWRPAAWAGLGITAIVMGALFFHHYFTRAQLGLVEFVLMIAVLGQISGVTLSILWPKLRGTKEDWMILAVWIMEAAWVLCGALWASWVVRWMHLTRLSERLFVLFVGWLAPPALVVAFYSCLLLVICLGELTVGVPSREMLLVPPSLLVSAWIVYKAAAIHSSTRRAEANAGEREEKIVLPREFTMNLRKRTTPEDLPLDTDDQTTTPPAAQSGDSA